MKKIFLPISIFGFLFFAAEVFAQDNSGEINIQPTIAAFGMKPIPVSLEGFSGEVAEVLKFDLYVQGFSFVAPDAAQYLISGSGGENVTGTLTDKFAHKMLLSRSYNGADT